MKLVVLLVCLLYCLNGQNQSLPISIDFNRFQAVFFQEQKLRLTFFCTGGNGNYLFQFKNIPNDWKVSANTISIQKFSITIRQNWRFTLNVTDTDGNFLSQSLLLNFMGAYVGLSSITLPVTGKLQNFTNISNNPVSKIQQNSVSLKNLNQTNLTLNQTNSNVQVEKPKLTDLVSSYPGIDPLQRFTVGFGIQRDSPLTTNLIGSSQAVYNPLRDSTGSSPYNAKKQSILKRQSQINQTLFNLFDLKAKFVTTATKLKQDSNNFQLQFNSSKQLVNQCDKQLVRLQDLKKKVNNAIKDKQEMINQYNLQVSQQEITIQAEVKKLSMLEQLKKRAQSQNLPNSRALQSLQKTLDLCKKSLTSNSQISQQNKLQVEKIQSQIRMLNIESNQAKGKIAKITDDLKNVRQKILSLEEQLREAKVYETNMLKQKSRLQQIPTTNDIRVLSLQSDVNSINSKSKSSQNNCRVYEAPIASIQGIINKDREKYNNIINDIKDQTAIVEKLKNQNLEIKKNSNTLPLQIQTLKKQEGSYDQSINRTSYLCDGRIAEYSKAAVGLKNVNDKISSSQKQIRKIDTQVSSAQSQQRSLNQSLDSIIRAQILLNRSVAVQSSYTNLPPSLSIPKNISFPTKVVQDSSLIINSSIVKPPSSTIDQIINQTNLNRDNLINKSEPTTATATQKFIIQPKLAQVSLSDTSSSNNQFGNMISSASSAQNLQLNNTLNMTGPPNNEEIKRKQNDIINISQNPEEIFDDGFKVSSYFGSKSAYVSDTRLLLKKLNIEVGNATISQNNYIYTLDDQTLRNLTMRGSSYAKLPLLSCSKPTLIDSGIIRDVGLGYIIASNGQTQFRLTFSQCTKIASTAQSGSLKQGTLIFFSGIPVVSLPKNMLVNTNFVFSTPKIN